MKRVAFIFLFFCLAITTILAQVVTTNIAAPVAGLSTNSVTDFDVNSDGTILNNSAADGTATLGSTAVTANSNITTGSEANLILLQVTGTGGSDLDGTIEVFGGEAGLIIANPNGITCDGCAFTNVNRVDLVTGSGYDVGTNTFSTIAATDITVEGDALELSNVDFNIQTGRDFSNDVAINADSLTVIAGADFKNAGAIVAESVTIDVTNFVNDIKNSGTVSATSLNLILTDDFTSFATTFNGFSFRNLALTTDGAFDNQNVFDLDNLTIKTGGIFSNSRTITADNLTATLGTHFFNNGGLINAASFTATVGAYFNNQPGSIINAISFTATVEETFNNLVSSVINTTNLTVTATTFNTTGISTIDADTITIEVPNFADDISNAGTISSASLNLILTDDFTHESDSFTNFNNFSNLAITTEGTFTNNDTIDLAGNLTITANSFDNTGGVVADALALSVAGDFEHSGTITANAYNFNIGGDFSYNDSANDFILGVNNILTVLGEASIDVAGFANSGNITITDSLNITANTFANSGGVLDAATFAISVAGDFEHSGTLTANTSNLTVGGNFSYDDSANDFTWGASDTLTVSGNVNIVAADFANSGAITVTNSGNFTANTFANTGTVSAATVTIGVTNFDDDITNTGTVSSASLNFILTDDFTHISTTFNAFNNFSNLAITTNGAFTNNNNIDLTGNLAITADGTFTNNNTIDLDGDFALTANTFNNTGGVVADALTVSVAGDFDYGTITANSYNLNVDGDFSYDDDGTNFVLGLNDTLTVLGSANIVAADFANSGTIAVTGSLGITAAGFDNSSIIRASSIFNVTVGDFTNRAGATITAAECNFVHDSFTDEGTITCLNSNTVDTTVDNIAEPNSSGLSVNNYEAFHIPVNGRVFNNSVSGATSQLLGDVPANPNFISGNAANIILAQVSGTEISLLLGAFEVVGAEAEVIIANPNGISCNGCSFINANRVDLVTGSNYDASTNTFGSIAATDITVGGSGLDAAVLNIQTGADFSNSATINADTVTIEVTNFVNDITNSGTVSSASLNFILTDDFTHSSTTFNAFNNFSNLAITTNGAFTNNNNIDLAGDLAITADGTFTNNNTIDLAGNLTITANSFANSGGVVADALTVSVAGDFDYGTITANTYNLNVDGDFSYDDSANDFVLGASDTLTVLGTASVVAADFANSGTINVSNSFNVTATDFTNNGTISANTTLNTTVTSTVSGSFNNTGGVVSADTVSLSVAGDFDDTKKGTINANYFNLTVGGRFINYNTNDDFVLAENDSLSILGDFTIDTNNYIQFGTLEVSGDLAIDAESDFANSGNITVAGALAIDASRNFANIGNITVTGSLGITAGYTAINQGSIVSESGSLDLTANDFFRNLTGGDIAVASLNITAGGKVTNTANINVEGTLNIAANNDSSRDNDPTGFYVSNRGNITATTLNIAAVDNFYNRGNITATNFNITRTKSVFFLNKEIDSFVGTYDGGNIFLDGDSSFRADGGIIENYGNIDLGNNILDISADSFTNQSGANVTADTLNLTVNSFIQNGSIDATIDQ